MAHVHVAVFSGPPRSFLSLSSSPRPFSPDTAGGNAGGG